MKKRILGILTVVLVLSMVFTVASCGDKGGGGNTWKITYNANGWTGGGIPSPKTIAKNAAAIGAANLPGLTDTATQRFNGWSLTTDGELITADYKVDKDITLYARWVAVVPAGEPINITYNANGWTGGNLPAAATGTSGTQLTAAQLPSLTHPEGTQTFNGWALTPDGAVLTTAYTPDSDITLYVKWTAVTEVTYFTVTFNYNYTGGPATVTIQVEEDTPIGTQLPANPTRAGFVFGGWYTAGGVRYTAESPNVSSNTALLARWIEDVLTGDDADELLYLQNGGYAFYKFEIPAGSTLADYESLSFDSKVSAAGLQVWDTDGLRGIRLYGVFDGTETVNVDDTGLEYDPPLPSVKYVNINTSAYNTPYRITNPGAAGIRSGVEADEWFTITHSLAGDGNADNDPHKPAAQNGTVYFALGIACQDTNKGRDRGKAFLQLVKDVKLNPKTTAAAVPGTKPGDDFAQFLCYDDPIVFEWRGEPTPENIANPPLPAVPESGWSRPGEVPADEDLEAVVLGVGTDDTVFTYINGGNVNNQRGWVSFTEAGRANNQTATVASTIAFSNFINAWYLVLETAARPTGTVALVWMGDADDWKQNNATGTSGQEVEGVSEITEKEGGGFIIKFFLPAALDPYQEYFEDNEEWAGLALSYWGADNTALIDYTHATAGAKTGLGITKAYLLVDKDEVAPSAESGVSLSLSFTLGTAPAGGALISDVVLDAAGTSLEITAASGLTDYRWYVDGVLDAEDSDTLTLTVAADDNLTVTLQAKRGGRWVSQAVNITVLENE